VNTTGIFLFPGVEYCPYKLLIAAPIPWSLVRLDLRPCAKLLYGRLVTYAGQDGACYPSVPTLGREMGWSERKVSRELAILVGLKLLRRWQPGWNRSAHCAFLWNELLADDLFVSDPCLQVGHPYNPYRRLKCIFIPLPIIASAILSSGAKLLFGVLANHAGEEFYCFPTLRQLCQETACSERTVQRYITQLVDGGFVRRYRIDAYSHTTYRFLWHPALYDGLRSDAVSVTPLR